MKIEQLRAEFEALENKRKGFGPDTLIRASIEPDDEYLLPLVQARWEGYQAGRAALQSQDREDAEWMTCESRRPYVVNSLKHIAKELRDAERRSRNTFKKGYMGEPARYFADACGEAAALFEAKLDAIDHARRIEGEGE